MYLEVSFFILLVLYKNVVSLHVRRGDYLLLSNFHHNLESSYYKNAINQFPIDTKYLVFSDDINWCKTIFDGDEYIFVENQSDIMDLYLMSLCKHNIIPNSTFSWWAAFLNKNNNKKIIVPSIWFGPNGPQNYYDMYESDWTKMDVVYSDGELKPKN